MKLPDEFREALARRPPSLLLALSHPSEEGPGITEARALLEASGLGFARLEPSGERAMPNSRWELVGALNVEGRSEPLELRFWLEPSPRQLVESAPSWRHLCPEDLETARRSAWAVGVSTTFGAAPLRDFHLQLRALSALAPAAALVLDGGSFAMHPGNWLREVAASRVPPTPTALYAIHAVPSGDAPDAPTWLHTHGLERCGSIELEMLDVPADKSGLFAQLLNTAAPLLIERGVPPPGEPFAAGDGLDLAWIPWQRALGRLPRPRTGTLADRGEGHAPLTGTLFAPSRLLFWTRLRPLTVYTPLLEANPLLWVTDMETERAALLAKERLDRFAALQKRFAGAEQWAFLVKLGYPVDGARSDSDREHLWFEVHGIEGSAVDATLANAPYRIAAMQEGQRGSFDLEKLSDWAIYCAHGRFDPDTVGELERVLKDAA